MEYSEIKANKLTLQSNHNGFYSVCLFMLYWKESMPLAIKSKIMEKSEREGRLYLY